VKPNTRLVFVALPHNKPCSACGRAVHVQGLCEAAQAYARQDYVGESPIAPVEFGDRINTGRVGTGHGKPEVKWPYSEREHRRLERNRQRRRAEVEAALTHRQGVRAAQRRVAEWPEQPAGVQKRAWEALTLREVYRCSWQDIADVLGLRSRQAAAQAAGRARKA